MKPEKEALDKLSKSLRSHRNKISIAKALKEAEKLEKQLSESEPVKVEILPNEVTVPEVCNRYSLLLGDMAIKMGVSISLLSKIKNGDSPITPCIQEKFQNAFPYNLTLIGGKEKWKTKYLEEVQKNRVLEAEIENLNKKLELYQKRFEKINALTSSPVENSVSVRIFNQGGD